MGQSTEHGECGYQECNDAACRETTPLINNTHERSMPAHQPNRVRMNACTHNMMRRMLMSAVAVHCLTMGR